MALYASGCVLNIFDLVLIVRIILLWYVNVCTGYFDYLSKVYARLAYLYGQIQEMLNKVEPSIQNTDSDQ